MSTRLQNVSPLWYGWTKLKTNSNFCLPSHGHDLCLCWCFCFWYCSRLCSEGGLVTDKWETWDAGGDITSLDWRWEGLSVCCALDIFACSQIQSLEAELFWQLLLHFIPHHAIPHHKIPHYISPYHTTPYPPFHIIPHHNMTIPHQTIPHHFTPNHSYHTTPQHNATS